MGGGVIMGSFFKGSTLFREDANGDYLKVNDLTPVNHWKLQETSGTDVNDGGSEPETLTNSNATVNQTGKISKGYDFNGTTARLTTSNVRTDAVGSYSAWIYREGDGSFQSLYSSCRTNSNVYNFNIAITSDNKFALFVRENTVLCYITTTNTIAQNTWVHLAVTSDGSTSKLYINGVEESVIVVSGSNNGSWLGDVTSRVNTNIGRTERQDITDYFDGLMEDVRLYDYPLSEQEIATIYNAGNGTLSNSLLKVYPTVQEPIHHWKLQEESGTDVNDTMGGLVLANTNATVNQTGKIGKAYSFNGSTSYCQASLPTDMKTATGSFAVWANFGNTAENTEAILTASKSGQNTRFAIRRSGTSEALQALCQENGTYQWIVGFDYQLTNAGWLHIVLTQDGVEPKFYVNGQEQTTTFQIDTDKTKWLTFANFDLFNIGVTKAMSDYGYFGGLMEDVRYYDYALGQQEIDNIYNNGKGLLL